jgi:Protein of unknown function (DUF5132)
MEIIMALFEDMFKNGAGTGLAVGIGALVLGPTLLPAIGRVLRPAAKAVIKGGMVIYRETMSEVGELTGDLVAEARAELEEGEKATTEKASRRVGHRGSASEAATS